MNNIIKSLRSLNESRLLEYNRKDLRNLAGDDYAAKFFDLRQKLQAPENNLDYWVKKIKEGGLDEFKTFIDEWESGARKSKTQQKKEEKIAGAELVFDDKGWKVYHITTYNAAKQLGSGTTWCITGRYRGCESRGQHYFDSYIESYKLDGYYFMFDTLNKEPKTGDYLKYCAGITTDNKLIFLYNGMQDREISKKGIPNIEPDRRVQPFADKGIELKYFDVFKISEDGVLTGFGSKDDAESSPTLVIPEGVRVISKFMFDEFTALESCTLPKSLKEIGTGAFASCIVLKHITLPEGLEKLGNGVFLGCESLNSINIPASITEIPAKMFAYCDNLNSVIIQGEITSIGDNSFAGLDNNDITFKGNCNQYVIDFANAHGFKCEGVNNPEETPVENVPNEEE